MQQCKLKNRKRVSLDVQTRWNSTFLMIESALPLKEAFNRLEQIDKNYKFNPTEEEWKVASLVHGCLKIFYDATTHFSGSHFPTSNVFFPDVCRIQVKLKEWENSEHDCLKIMAGPMKIKFEKYWEECCLVLGIAVVLDPRFKMDLVEFYYNAIYGDNVELYVERVRNAFQNLYIEYGGQLSSLNNDEGDTSGCRSQASTSIDELNAFDQWYKESRSSSLRIYQKPEIDQYLEEPVFPRNESFNILEWWKANSPKYPTIGSMARDILAVPATTVASESAFSVGGRVIDELRASLLPDIVEALIPTSDWIESRKKRKTFEDDDAEGPSLANVARMN